MVPARILIAEDDPSICSLLRTCLVAEGYAVDEARDGQETLDAVTQDRPPDIVLLDLSMPAPQGMEVLYRLNNMAVRPRPRVIVLTANGSVARAVEAMKLGAFGFLEKPCDPLQLLAAIGRALDQKILSEVSTAEGYTAALARARQHLTDGKLEKVEGYLRAASRFADRDGDYFYLLGLWHELNERKADACAAYQQAAELDPRQDAIRDALRRLAAP